VVRKFWNEAASMTASHEPWIKMRSSNCPRIREQASIDRQSPVVRKYPNNTKKQHEPPDIVDRSNNAEKAVITREPQIKLAATV
jgi:hypothetical protein